MLGGSINSGKNFAYDLISNELGHANVHREFFARELKDTCKDAFSRYAIHINQSINDVLDMIDESSFEGYDKATDILSNLLIKDHNWYEDKTDSTRIILQSVGTDIVKNKIDQDHWVKCAAKAIVDTDKEYIVFTDFRYASEYTSLIEQCHTGHAQTDDYQFYPISIERTANTKSTIAEHASENGLVNFDDWYGHIDNNGTIEQTTEQIKVLLQQIQQD